MFKSVFMKLNYMDNLKSIHENILKKIKGEGALEGILTYREHKEIYEKLPTEHAEFYWREIFQAIEKKENLQPISILAKDDPFNDVDLFSLAEDELLEIRKYRQNLPLDISLANYIFDVYENSIKLFHKWKEIPISN